MSPLESAILGLYFLTLVILAVFGLHRYIMVFLYFRHRDRRARARAPARAAAAGHRPAPHLQRDVRGGAAARVGVPHPLPAGAAGDPGPRRLHRRDDGHRAQAAVDALPRAGLRHPLPPPRRPHRLQGGRPRSGPEAGQGRVHPDLRRRLRGARRTSSRRRWATSPTRRWAWCRCAGATSTATTRCSPRCSRSSSTATSSWSTAGATAPAASSTSTAPPGVWRREAIEDAGGWQHDTLTEDLDLSYRAQMKGWRFVYLQDVVSPGRDPGGDERLQEPAVPLGQGLRSRPA